MAERSAIEWTDATYNPWRGCDKVSPGCAHCYMFDGQRRYGRDPSVLDRLYGRRGARSRAHNRQLPKHAAIPSRLSGK
jgi:protein gp37